VPFRDDLKRGLGFPMMDVEVDDTCGGASAGKAKDDFDFLMERTLRIFRTYVPCIHIVKKDVPGSVNGRGEGMIDVSGDNFLAVHNVYVIKPMVGTHDVLLPWSTTRIWEQIWVGKSDFLGMDLLLYRNEIDLINRVTNNRFDWRYVNGKVYVTRVPSFGTAIGIEGLKGVDRLDDFPVDCIFYEMALKYAIALGKQRIGSLWRKYQVDGMSMPGSEVVSEGREEERDVFTWIEANATYPGGIST
jgi:hypothetical protein